MKLAVIMDPIEKIIPEKDGTLDLLLAAQNRNYELTYFEQQNLRIIDGRPLGKGKPLTVKDDPKQIYKALNKKVFNEPMLINIHTNRLYWHAGAGKDETQVFDRLKNEIKILGSQGKMIDENIKREINNLWQKHLKKL